MQHMEVITKKQQNEQVAGLNNADCDIVTRAVSGFPVSSREKEFSTLMSIVEDSFKIIAELNTGYHSHDEARILFSQLIGSSLDEEFRVFPPFYTDFGKNISVGKNVFINQGCTFMDRGGITIGDGCLIGPKVNLVTINHAWNPTMRHVEICKPIVIGKNVWIGIGASVLPGVTIGDGAVISAGAVVTKNIPANTVAAGIPAKPIRIIEV